ncbi:MAG: hypothetical protein JWN30_1188 [Bacilli bacterium]|nr:hypothetical protein [Bacilli bacterium]
MTEANENKQTTTADTEAAPVEAADKPAAPVKTAAAKPAAAAKPPVEESPETIAKRAEAQKRLDEMKAILEDKFGEGALEETGLQKFQPTLVIKPEYWLPVVTYLAHDESLTFNYPECFAGTDYPAKGFIEVALYLYSMSNGRFITVKVRTPRDNAEVDSLCSVFEGANWEEREIYDLLGVNFKGHPNLVRIMMDDDYKGHPLRKDFSVWEQQ